MTETAIEELENVIAEKERELELLKESLEVLRRRASGKADTGVSVSKGGKRRSFSSEFKRQVLAEIESGAKIQDVLDRHGLYASHISAWRKQSREGKFEEKGDTAPLEKPGEEEET